MDELDNIDKLTNKQKMFCLEYIKDWNATRAAIAAGYSEKTANVIGSENLAKPYIKDYITQLQSNIEKVVGVSKTKILERLVAIMENSNEAYQLKAIETINKMLGYNEAEKRDIAFKNDNIPPIEWTK